MTGQLPEARGMKLPLARSHRLGNGQGMLDVQTIERSVGLLLEVAPAGSKVILFGSHACGDARPDSDLDFLVIEPTLSDHRREMTRLHHALQPLRVPADVLVTSSAIFEEWRDTPGTVLYEAAKEGKVFDGGHCSC